METALALNLNMTVNGAHGASDGAVGAAVGDERRREETDVTFEGAEVPGLQ